MAHLYLTKMILRISILLLIAFNGNSQSGQFIMNEIDQTALNDNLLNTRYGTIAGSPYLFDDFYPGRVQFANGQELVFEQMRIDLFSQGIQVKNDESIIEYEIWLAKSMSLDSGHGGASIAYSIIGFNGKRNLFRIIFDQQIKFLSLVSIDKRISEATQTGYSTESQQDRFVRSQEYFLYNKGELVEVKLNKKSILGELNQSSDLEDFVKSNKIKFKDEGDIVVLLDFYSKNMKTL